MRFPILLATVASMAHGNAGAIPRQIIQNPIPTPVEKLGLAVEVRDVVRLPQTRGMRPPDLDVSPAGWARVSYMRDLPDGRRFVNDSRGFLYLVESDERPRVYLNFAELFPDAVYNRLLSGFVGFDFHPEFEQNGLFYTVHGEYAQDNPASPHFIPPGFSSQDVTFHNVITEWRAADPLADVFNGTRRVLLRVAHVVGTLTHPLGHAAFNPTAAPGDEDYGLLYIGGTDLGFSNGAGPNANNPGQLQRLDSLVGAILRVDPRSPSVSGGDKGIGDYTIPPANAFAVDGDPNTLGEIYAHGFRNAHRILLGSHGRHDVRLGHRDEPHRRDQYRPERGKLWLDGA